MKPTLPRPPAPRARAWYATELRARGASHELAVAFGGKRVHVRARAAD